MDAHNNNSDIYIEKVSEEVKRFYEIHMEIKESHGIKHVLAVVSHAQQAIECHSPPLSQRDGMEILVASYLHDVDDAKYFFHPSAPFENAKRIMDTVGIPSTSTRIRILYMINLVSCSKNGNSVPQRIKDANDYHLLIPRWCDRLEAVGKIGVLRCFQYTKESGGLLWSRDSPRCITVDEIWEHATPERFQAYQIRGGTSSDMISHYYDKLLRVARPPSNIVCNEYLEQAAEVRVQPLIDVCLHFGRTGVVDEDYILGLCR